MMDTLTVVNCAHVPADIEAAKTESAVPLGDTTETVWVFESRLIRQGRNRQVR